MTNNADTPKHSSFIVELIHDPETGDLILPLPEEVWREMVEKHGWAGGDVISWKEVKDGSWLLSKKKPKPKRRRK